MYINIMCFLLLTGEIDIWTISWHRVLSRGRLVA